ncbi:unnamed protein product [Haemonchus placei]|uniref:ShKT domain-containing protein n=1 Tax=Haemonchus placei TaxID=6290 RepID=A0A0N4W7P4_HAEPC|nr:unnamed protein product [Haemonchus placei]
MIWNDLRKLLTFQFLPSATVCEDLYATTACASLFGTAVVAEGTTDRDAKCLTVCYMEFPNIFPIQDEDVKAIAIASCPKSCGYCCMTPEYKCKNKDFPRTKCETVTPAQCKDPSWRPILAEDCPNVCGFCLEGGCVDTVIECENDPTICRNVDMQDFVKVMLPNLAVSTVSPTDVIVSSNVNVISYISHNSLFYYSCANWVKNGFCTNSFYTAEQRKLNCAKSCGVC